MVIACIISFAVGALIMMCAIGLMSYQKDKKPQNKVHFYVTRDIDRRLELWIGKPIRIYGKYWIYESEAAISKITDDRFINNFNLNISDFDNLTYDDEPVEVFLNLED